MAIELVEVSDTNDNILYPHTSAEVVFFSDSSISNLVNKSTYHEFMVAGNQYRTKEYDVGGYIRGGELWFSGESFIQSHYIGAKIEVTTNSKNYTVSLIDDTSTSVTVTDVVVFALGNTMNTLSKFSITYLPNTKSVSQDLVLPEGTKWIVVGVHADTSLKSARIAHSLVVTDTNSTTKSVESFRNDLRNGNEVVGKSALLQVGNTTLKLVVSSTPPTAEPDKTIIWIDDTVVGG